MERGFKVISARGYTNARQLDAFKVASSQEILDPESGENSKLFFLVAPFGRLDGTFK